RAGVVARRAARPEGDAGAHPVCVWAADMTRSSVAAVVADGVARAGVPRVFASPGASVPIGDAAIARGLAVVETAGATAAGVMAAVTAELVDAPGVALVSFAGGIAPVLDGAAHATRDRAAVIVISDGAADSRLLEPVVKATVVADPASAGHWIAHAAQLCMADPRGAVHLVVPAGVAEAPALPVVTACRRAPVPAPAADALDALADSIARAARPVLVAGLETGPDDAKWLRALAESVPAPVLTTPKGKGALPDPHPLVLGLLAAEHPLLAQSDLLIVVGVDPVEVSPGVWPAGVPLAPVGRAPGGDGPRRRARGRDRRRRGFRGDGGRVAHGGAARRAGRRRRAESGRRDRRDDRRRRGGRRNSDRRRRGVVPLGIRASVARRHADVGGRPRQPVAWAHDTPQPRRGAGAGPGPARGRRRPPA